jgi:hypothetical protein
LVLGTVGAVKPAGEPQPSDKTEGWPAARSDGAAADTRLGPGGPTRSGRRRRRSQKHHPIPEINAQKARENGNIGIDDITEYFLVGSFASWILALGGLVLAQ